MLFFFRTESVLYTEKVSSFFLLAGIVRVHHGGLHPGSQDAASRVEAGRHVEGQGADVSGWVVVRRMTWPSLSIYTPRWRLAATVLLSFVMFVMTRQVSSGTARIRSNG
jgi:hypothetical protein